MTAAASQAQEAKRALDSLDRVLEDPAGTPRADPSYSVRVGSFFMDLASFHVCMCVC